MFITFALITLLGALGMLLQKNVIVAGLFMVAAFFGVAGLFVLLANPVAAALQIIVYTGAIMVAALAFGAVKLVLASPGLKALAQSGAAVPEAMTLQKVGVALFADHLLGFEVAGLLLLAAMIGAVALTKRNL